MCSIFVNFLFILILSLAISPSTTTLAQGIKSARLLDLLIRDYTLKSFDNDVKTGLVKSVNLPTNFSGVNVNTARFRCGSLRRYGAKIDKFHLDIGVIVHPCVERVLVISQNLGPNWSQIYYENYELLGYKLISPVLGLLAYNGGDNFDFNLSNPFEINIIARNKNSIEIDFSKIIMSEKANGLIPLCASFQHNGKVLLSHQVAQNVCAAKGQGHFGMVVEWPEIPVKRAVMWRWKVAVGATVGAGLGFFLLGLLLVALFVKVKRKAKMEAMERSGYEHEALRMVNMVGHVKAHVALGTRTNPAIEHGYRPPPPS